jgi:hypothetical protein
MNGEDPPEAYAVDSEDGGRTSLAPISVPPPTPFPELISAAWAAYGDPRRVLSMVEISANVSTNNVYRLKLSDGHELIAKSSSYGSYVHFRQDHQLIQQWIRLLGGTRFQSFLAPMLQRDHEVFTYRQGYAWVAFYRKAPFYDFLPKLLTEPQVDALARELAEFHRVSALAAKRMNPTWKSLGSDIASLYDALGSANWRKKRGFDDSVETDLRRHCDLFLNNADKLGYHKFEKLPVLVDWNIGNFSVGFDYDGFRMYSRWDYDWFRIEPRTLDFYFCARVVRSDGDQTLFSYLTDPFFEPRFARFLREYHRVNPLEEKDILFLKEAYRFFILNYVVRSGEHFFRPSYCHRLQREAVENYLPRLEHQDFSPLLKALE